MRVWGGGRAPAWILLAAALALGGCASAYRKGQSAGRKGDWDLAVARYTKALEKDPENIKYRIALESARVEAAAMHQKLARKHLAAEDLDKARDELEIATKFDPGNQAMAGELRVLKDRIQRREDEKSRRTDYESMRERAQSARVPLPVLSPRSQSPISLKFADTSLEKVFDALSKLAGVNVIFDEGYRDKRVSFNVTGVSFEEALDQLTFVNRLFYKVLDQNTIIVVPESAQKRRQYDDNLVQTFYLQNAEVNETVALLTKLAGIQKVAGNASLGAITIVATPDRMALAQRIIEANDKARGEVMVEVEILEVNRTIIKKYGIELSQYEGSVTLSPTGASGEVASGFTSVRAHLLSSLNLADFVVNIPSTLFARFLQTESSVRILASPRLRAAEGKKTSLKVGQEVPIPVTTFTATSAGTSTFAPATSFQYKTVGVTLDLTPKVSAGGEITLELLAEFSLLGDDRNVGTGQNPIVVPTFLTRNVTGILRVRDGETSLIGGLLQGRDAANVKGAFGIQSIPVLNKLLGSHQAQRDESEVLISLTPHVVRAAKLTEEDLKSLYIGTEDLPRVANARPPLFGAPEAEPQGAVTAPAPGPRPRVEPSPAATSGVPGGMPAPPSAGAPPGPVAPPSPGPAGVPPAAQPQAAAGPTVVVRPPQASLRVGEEASFDIVVLGGKDLLGVDLAVSFEGGLVEAVEVMPGALLTLDGAAVGAQRSLEGGRARARFTRPTGASGSGAVATLRVRALKPGSGAITVAPVSLITPAGMTPLPGAAQARLSVAP